MIDWGHIYDFMGFILTGAISILGFFAVIALFIGVMLFFMSIGYLCFTYIKGKLK